MIRARSLGCFALLLLGACVTEPTKPGLRIQGRPVGASADSAPEGGALPTGPVAAPVTNASFSSSVQVEVGPLGGVAYDGQVLPLISPDGKFLVSQEGPAPSWPTLLAAPGASVPMSTRLVVYDISKNPCRVVTFAKPLPRGLLLGRASEDSGFLVEAPQPGGSRWIGRVAWGSGALEWLVRDGRVNAHAVLTPAGSIAWIAREVASDEGSLVLRAVDGTQTTRSGAGLSHLVPVASPEPGILCSLARSQAGLELVAWSLEPGGSHEASVGGPERLGSIVSRALVTTSSDAAMAYQVTAPCCNVLPRRVETLWRGERPVIYHPGFGRMAEFDRASAGFILLPEHSIAAARAIGASADGWFVTTPSGLVFSPDAARVPPEPGQHRTIQSPRVLADPYVPRQTTSPDRPLVLLGPSKRDPTRLAVVALRFAAPRPVGE